MPMGGCSPYITKEGEENFDVLLAGHKPLGLHVRQHKFKGSLIYTVSSR